MRGDLLGVAGELGTLEALIHSEERPVQEYAVWLVNTIANQCAGRSYLLTTGACVRLLVEVMMGEAQDSVMRQHCLGALQKFSLRRVAQSQMIRQGVVEWIVGRLAEPESLSGYSIEYGTALLMNLSFRTAGKIRCEAPDLRVCAVLSDLLENELGRTYVNGTLYSILGRHKIREQARAIGLKAMLQYVRDSTQDDAFAKQIDYILMQLESTDTPKDGEAEDEDVESADDAEDDDDDEEDDVIDDAEDDIDIGAPPQILAGGGTPQGELLLGEYALHGQQQPPRPPQHPHAPQRSSVAAVPAAHAAPAHASPTRQESPIPPSMHPAARVPKHNLNAYDEYQELEDVVSDEPVSRPTTPKPRQPPQPRPPPTPKGGIVEGGDYDEYVAAFATRAKLARTPAGTVGQGDAAEWGEDRRRVGAAEY